MEDAISDTPMRTERGGRVSVTMFGATHKATWRIIDRLVEVTSPLGTVTAPLDLMPYAPATIAREKLAEAVKRAAEARKAGQTQDQRARFDIRDATGRSGRGY